MDARQCGRAETHDWAGGSVAELWRLFRRFVRADRDGLYARIHQLAEQRICCCGAGRRIRRGGISTARAQADNGPRDARRVFRNKRNDVMPQWRLDPPVTADWIINFGSPV